MKVSPVMTATNLDAVGSSVHGVMQPICKALHVSVAALSRQQELWQAIQPSPSAVTYRDDLADALRPDVAHLRLLPGSGR